jgi:hypothetical protein
MQATLLDQVPMLASPLDRYLQHLDQQAIS